MSDDPMMSADAASSQEGEVKPKRRIRKRVIIIPFVVAALFPVGFGAVALASPVLAHMEMKSDLANTGEAIQSAKDAAGEYREPVFVKKRYENSTTGADIDNDSFGPVVIGNRSEISATELPGGEFCATGYVDGVFYEEAWFYSSVTGGVSKNASDCLNTGSEGDTYKCLPETKDLLFFSLDMLESPGYREAVNSYEKELSQLEAEDASNGRFDAASIRHENDPEVKKHFASWGPAGDVVMDTNEAMDTLSYFESVEREEFGMGTPEFGEQKKASDAYAIFLEDEANYGEDGDFLPGKKEQAQKLYDEAQKKVDDYAAKLCG